MRYTYEKLADAVAHSVSLAGVLRYLGLKQAGGTQSHIKRLIVHKYKLNTSHFVGQAHRRNKDAFNKKHWSEHLIQRTDGCRARASVLRRCLKEAGVDYKCVQCNNIGDWQNQPLVLEVDHIDGDFTNNVIDNLQFMCPNCHSQKQIHRVGQTYL